MGCGNSLNAPPESDSKSGAIPTHPHDGNGAPIHGTNGRTSGHCTDQNEKTGKTQGTTVSSGRGMKGDASDDAMKPQLQSSHTKPYAIGKGLVGTEPLPSDQRATPEHFFLIFSLWPVVRPGVPEFLNMLCEKKKACEVQRIYIYTANTSLHWVRFIMQCIMQYYGISLDTFDGIKHAPGGLKVVPDGAVLYDDHPENAIGNCVAVDPYTNEIPWEILGPILQKLPDHTEASCPLWEECGGLQKFIERDQQYEDPPHNEASETTMFDLMQEFVAYDEVLLDLDETLIAGARLSAYFNALNHFLMFREDMQGNGQTDCCDA